MSTEAAATAELPELDALAASAQALGELDWAAIPVGRRLNQMEALETVIRQLRAVSYVAAASLACEDTAVLGDKAHNVIANKLRIGPAAARRRIRTAELMEDRITITGAAVPPVLDAAAPAWKQGRIDEEHLTVIRDLLVELPSDVPFEKRQWAQKFLAEHALTKRPDELRLLAGRLAATLNPDGNFTDVERDRKRALTLGRQQADGMSKLTGYLRPELRAALEAILNKLAAPGKCNPDDPSPCVDSEATAAGAQRDCRSTTQRNHDGLLAACRALLASGELGSHHGLPVSIVVTTTLEQMLTGAGIALTGTGTALPMAEVIRMARHAYHYLVIFDNHTSLPLYLGRSRRTASTAQRLVLGARDRGCTFPGCTVAALYCEADHIDEWVNDGQTNIDVLALNCPQHHKLHTNGGWKLRLRPDGRVQWIPPPQLDLPLDINHNHHPEDHLPPGT